MPTRQPGIKGIMRTMSPSPMKGSQKRPFSLLSSLRNKSSNMLTTSSSMGSSMNLAALVEEVFENLPNIFKYTSQFFLSRIFPG